MTNSLRNSTRYYNQVCFTDLMLIIDMNNSSPNLSSLPQILDLMQLTSFVDRISILAFANYNEPDFIQWSEWHYINNKQNLLDWTKDLQQGNKLNNFKAIRSVLIEACNKLENQTVCLLYINEPCLNFDNVRIDDESEIKDLNDINYDNFTKIDKNNRMRLYSIIPKLNNYVSSFFISISESMNGICLVTKDSVKTTIGILSNLMGEQFKYKDNTERIQFVNKQNHINMDNIIDCTMHKNIDNLLENEEILEYENYIKLNKFREILNIEKIHIDEITEWKSKKQIVFNSYCSIIKLEDISFNIFMKILTSGRVIEITYNIIFHTIWIFISNMYKDPNRQTLIIKFYYAIRLESSINLPILLRLENETHNKSQKIQKIISNYKYNQKGYVLNFHNKVSHQIILDLVREYDKNSISIISKYCKQIIIVKLSKKHKYKSYIPVEMGNTRVFGFLPCLLNQEMIFESNLSVIIAIVCFKSQSILKKLATAFLLRIKGKWINFKSRLYHSVKFAEFIFENALFAITEDEKTFLNNLLIENFLRRTMQKTINFETAYSFQEIKCNDIREICKFCKQYRSLTFFTEDKCVICKYYTGIKCVDKNKKRSWMSECTKCLSFYAIYNYKELNNKFLCRFCVLKIQTPHIICINCDNKYIYDKTIPRLNFTCGICQNNNNKILTKAHHVNLHNIFTYNEQNKFLFDVDVFTTMINENKNIITEIKITESEKDEIVKFEKIETLKKCLNFEEVSNQLKKIYENMNLKMCMICYSFLHKNDLNYVCNTPNTDCNSISCNHCLQNLYSEFNPGKIFNISKLQCPFCKKIPCNKILLKYNKKLHDLLLVQDISFIAPEYVYAWCLGCARIKEAFLRVCGGENSVINDFKCGNCTEKLNFKYRTCPKCKVWTDKINGCNNIKCNNIYIDSENNTQNCIVHWCWLCKFHGTEQEVYAHLLKVHGSYV